MKCSVRALRFALLRECYRLILRPKILCSTRALRTLDIAPERLIILTPNLEIEQGAPQSRFVRKGRKCPLKRRRRFLGTTQQRSHLRQLGVAL